jgi:hypothetical protein
MSIIERDVNVLDISLGLGSPFGGHDELGLAPLADARASQPLTPAAVQACKSYLVRLEENSAEERRQVHQTVRDDWWARYMAGNLSSVTKPLPIEVLNVLPIALDSVPAHREVQEQYERHLAAREERTLARIEEHNRMIGQEDNGAEPVIHNLFHQPFEIQEPVLTGPRHHDAVMSRVTVRDHYRHPGAYPHSAL